MTFATVRPARPRGRAAASVRAIAAAFGLVAIASAGSAWAQTASSITPSSFRPPLESGPTGVVVAEGPGLDTPEGADRLTLSLASVEVEGGRPEMATETAAITAGLTGRTITAAEAFAAARRLEAAYARAGFVLARVALPAQTLTDAGVLKLIVIDGYVERVDASALPDRLRGRVEAMLAPVVGRPGLKMRELERRLLLAGDISGARLRSTLVAGSARGATVLVIDGAWKPVSGQLTFDNASSPQLGNWSGGIGLDAGNLLGGGELFYLRAGGLPQGGKQDDGYLSANPRSRTLAAGMVLPIGLDGLTANVEATQTRANPSHPWFRIGFGSVFERYSLRLRYPLVRSRAATIAVELGLDAQTDEQLIVHPITVPIAKDRLRILRAGVDGVWFTEAGGVLTGNLRISQGLSGLGARTAEDATPLLPLTRMGADADFRKLELSLAYSHPLATHAVLDLNLRAQSSFGDPLPQSEQMGIATPTALSTFDAGSLQGDNGYAMRAQLSSPWIVRRGDKALSASPYLFGATGRLRLEQPTFFEREQTAYGAYGLGLRLAAGAQDGRLFSVSVEWGRQHRTDDMPTDERVTLSGVVQF